MVCPPICRLYRAVFVNVQSKLLSCCSLNEFVKFGSEFSGVIGLKPLNVP